MASWGSMVRIESADTPARIEQVRALFLEYAGQLGLSLCFQGFDAEVAGLPGRYAPPRGQLLLAMEGETAVGCIGLRPLEGDCCEMKRLYVRASHRGRGLGRTLAERVLAAARTSGYRRMLLDTLPSMERARQLYAALGFRVTQPYTANPVEGVVYMEIDLPEPGTEPRPPAPPTLQTE